MALGQARYAQINTPLSQKLAQKKCLIAVHRGSWGGNITQNTIGAYAAALQMGADMVESDVNATTDGVVRVPSALVMTVARPPSMVATQLLVVPRSMPITAIAHPLLRPWCVRFSQLYPRRVTQRLRSACAHTTKAS